MRKITFGTGVSLMIAAVLAVPAVATSPSPPTVEVIASGLDNPRGLAFGPDDALYVAEAGRGGSGPCITDSEPRFVCYGTTGAITRIAALSTFRVVTHLPSLAPPPGQPGAGTGATGVHDLAFDHWTGVALIGWGANPALRALLGVAGAQFGHLARFGIFHPFSFDQDISAYEAANNPDGGGVESNPYGLALVGSDVVVADAGANDVIKVASHGNTTTLGVFPNVLVPFGPPGNMIPMQAVPTTVRKGPDGALYVGQLTGFPFPAGGASIFRVPSDGGVPETFATGFTNIIDLAFGEDQSLYVLEISAGGLLSGNPVGALVHVAANGTRSEVAPGALISPGGVVVRGGWIYVSRFSTLPGAGDVVRIRR